MTKLDSAPAYPVAATMRSDTKPDLDIMRAGADDAAAFLKQLANPDRLMILCHLAERELTVSEMEQIFNVRQPTMSQRLAKLRDSGLVTTRRDGKAIYYRLASEEARVLIHTLYDMFCGVPDSDG